MAKRRLKADPESIDLILAALMVARNPKGFHAGYYALGALGQLFVKNLPGEEGPITATNLKRRLDRLNRELGFPQSSGDKIYQAWRSLRTDLEKKISYLPSYRKRRVTRFALLVADIFEDHAGIPIKEVVDQMTIADLARLEQGFGVKLIASQRKKPEFEGFCLKDFDNLLVMRDKIEVIGRYLKKKFMGQLGLTIGPETTAADFTSGWASTCLLGFNRERPRDTAGFQILATPTLIMAGVTFAESATALRSYYNKLGREKSPDLKDMAEQGARLINLYWFSTVTDSVNLLELSDKELEKLAQDALLGITPPPFVEQRLIPARLWTRQQAAVGGESILEEISKLYDPAARLVATLQKN